MSSGEEDYADGEAVTTGSAPGSKTRKIQRACDICRRKKIRCDGGQMPGNICSNCITCSYKCTYVEAAKKRGPPKGYVEDLESRLEKMQKLLSKLCSDGDLPKELGGVKNWLQSMDVAAPMRSTVSIEPPPTSLLHTFRLSTLDDNLILQDSDTEQDFADAGLGDTSGNQPWMQMPDRFLKFSDMSKAWNIPTRNESPPNKLLSSTTSNYLNSHVENIDTDVTPYEFPDNDLMAELFNIYFRCVNIFMPLLHRPTFEKAVADRLHLRNSSFGALVLMVCAVSSRFSNNPRVFSPGDPELSAGWKWFAQIRMSERNMVATPCLYDLQVRCISVTFLMGSSAAFASWTIIGIGIRLVQVVGANKRETYGKNLTVESELWKRAVWSLLFYDRVLSNSLGRPCAMQDEDFDIDFPIECDDEYLEQSELENTCKQPSDTPSILTYFVTYLKLNQVLAFALRTIYANNEVKKDLGFVGHQWDQHIVAEIESALNKWFDDIPDHLRWDPNREDEIFSTQSACTQISYYQLQIVIHRPFISSTNCKLSPLSFSSLASCINAARSCIHVADTQRLRSNVPLPHLHAALFTAGITLLLSIWSSKRSGLSIDAVKEMHDVQKCLTAFRLCENRWYSAGRFWDIIHGLADVGGFPLPKSPGSLNKRARDSDVPKSASPSSDSSTPSPSSTGEPRSIAGSKRVSHRHINRPPAPKPVAVLQLNPLLTYNDGVAQLPVHTQGCLPNTLTNSNYLNEIRPATLPADNIYYGQVGDNFQSFDQTFGAQGQYGTTDYQLRSLTGMDPHQEQLQMINDDPYAIWNNAPVGFESDEWGAYVNHLSYSQPHGAPQHQS